MSSAYEAALPRGASCAASLATSALDGNMPARRPLSTRRLNLESRASRSASCCTVPSYAAPRVACWSPGPPTPHEMNSPLGASGTSWPSARPSRQRTPVDHAQHRVGGGVVRELDHRVEYVAEAHGSVLDPPRRRAAATA